MTKLSIEAYPQCALFASTSVLLHIIDFLRKVIKGLMNRYLDDVAIYGITYQNQYDSGMAADLNGKKHCLVFSVPLKVISFNYQRGNLEIILVITNNAISDLKSNSYIRSLAKDAR